MLPSGSAIERMLGRNEGLRLRDCAGVTFCRTGDLINGVNQHFRVQPAQRIKGEIGGSLADGQ